MRLLLLTTLILTLSSCAEAAAEIHANSTIPIQTAVNNANPGDVILVAPGIYTENIFINKDDLVIRSSGSPEDTKIVANNSSTYVIKIQNGDRVTIQGLNVSGGLHGIVLEGATDSILENNVVHSNLFFGIYLSNSNNITLASNTMFNNTNGIDLVFSSGNTISGNTVFNDTLFSNTHNIFLNNSHNNNLQSNTVSNGDYGIAMRYSNNNNLTNNNASGNSKGIYLTLTSRTNTLSGNQVNSNSGSGIILDNAGSGNNLINNTVRLNTANGIWLANSNNNYLTNNNASQNSKGIYLQSSASGNILSGNIANLNLQGIMLENAGSNNNLTSNTVASNVNYGIYLVSSSNNYLISNTAPRNSKGIYIVTSTGNTVSNNILSDTAGEGIMLSLSDSNILSRNRASNNSAGIYLNSSDSNTISGNTITASTSFSIGLCAASNGNQIFDNYFNSTYNTRVRNASNYWNTTKTAGKSIAGGPYLGGNFWGKPDGQGHSQTYPDADGDGITEQIFGPSNNVTDYLPLVYVPEVVLPVANFSTNVSSGYAPLAVQFTDLSEDANLRSWDVNNDGVEDSSDESFVYVYTAAGTYTVNLTVSNPNGTDSKTADITVLEEGGEENETDILPVADFTVNKTSGYYPLTVLFTDTSQNAIGRSWDVNGDGVEDSTEASFVYTYTSRGTYEAKLTAINGSNTDTKITTISVERKSSGGSSGGGGGGSPESSRNIEVKEISQVFIANGKAIQFDFTKKATCVVFVGFDSKKTAGKTTTIAEQLKNKSVLVSGLPSDEVYKFFNIWVGNSGFATEKNIENPVIGFKVEKAWVQDEKIDPASITLNRYSDKNWGQLPTTRTGEDGKYLYFTAETPGFSSFAITGNAIASQEETVTEIQPEDEPGNSEENTEDPGSEAEQETEPEESTGMPGFEMLYGVAGLLAVFLYKRK